MNEELNDLFGKWLGMLESYHAEIEKSVDDIRMHKAEIQAIKKDLYNKISAGRFIQDEKRIVISAPEIIIGNVDKSGQLKKGTSVVVIRGNCVDIEGVGIGGIVQTNATTISHIAKDPGPEGLDEIVHSNSKIVSQARSVVIDSNESNDIFTHDANCKLLSSGIVVHSDSKLQIDASKSLNEHTVGIDDRIKVIKEEVSDLKKQVDEAKKNLDERAMLLKEALSLHQEMCEEDKLADSNGHELEMLQEDIDKSSQLFFINMDSYVRKLSILAEKLRQQHCFDLAKSEESEEDFVKNNTGAIIEFNAERIDMTCYDGDNHLKETDETGINLLSKNITLCARNPKDANIKDGKITIHGENVELTTHDSFINGGDIDKPAAGKLSINSKEINITSIDSEKKKDEEEKEKALTEEGKLSIRVKNIDISGTDTEGTPVGTLSINERDTTLGTLKKDDSGNETVEEGTLSVKTTAISVGVAESTKTIAMESEEVSAKAKKSYKVDQDGKASLELSDDKIALKSSKKEIDGGKSTFKDDADFQGNLTAKQAKIQQLEVSTKFKSPSIQDGM